MADDSFLTIATDPSVVRRAAKIALIVGVILALINHGHLLIAGDVDAGTMARIALTFFVPYSVSTYSSVQAVRDRMQMLESRE